MRLDRADRENILAGIKEEGTSGLWAKSIKTPIDPDKPWLGSHDVPDEKFMYCLFVDAATAQSFIRQYSIDTEISFRSLYGILGWQGFDLEVGETFYTKSGKTYVARKVAKACPADVPIFFVVEFDA